MNRVMALYWWCCWWQGVGNDWNLLVTSEIISERWNMAWKFYYFTHILIDESWCNDRLRKITENILTLKTTVKIYLNYEILWTEIWNMSPEIFQKVEIWALIFLSLKFRRRFSIITYPSVGGQSTMPGRLILVSPTTQFATNMTGSWRLKHVQRTELVFIATLPCGAYFCTLSCL